MTPEEANALLTYARGLDALVPNTQPNYETWVQSLAHIPYKAGQVIISDYYGKHLDPDRREPITPAHIRKLYGSMSRVYEAQQRNKELPPGRKGSGAPRWFVERMQQRGHLKDRDLSNYR